MTPRISPSPGRRPLDGRARVGAAAVVVAVVVVAVGCGEIEEPEGFAIATSTSVAAPSDTEQVEEEPTAEVLSESPSTTEFVPTREDGYLPTVLISTGSAVLSADADGARPLTGSFGNVSSTHAIDDLLGGLVVQLPSDVDEPGDVVWLPAQGEEPVVVDRGGARLLDVGYVGGSPSAVVLVDGDQVDRIRLVDNARTSMIEFSSDESVLDLSASGGLHALVLANERCGDLQFYAADGARIDLNGPGEPDCIVPRRPAYGAVALSPDAGAVVYTMVSYRDDGIEVATELIARDLGTGEEYYRRKIGEDRDRITALSFDGQRVAYLRRNGQEGTVSVLDLNQDLEMPIDLAGSPDVEGVSFARLPLAGS